MPDRTVYVVDDDRSVRRSLSRLLRGAGFTVETFATAEAMLDASLEPNSCAIIDIHLPGIDGVELQSRLAGSIPVVAISGHGVPATRERALGAGASSFLDKPFSDTDLFEAIELALQKSL